MEAYQVLKDIGYGFDNVENGKKIGQWKTTITFGQQF